MNEFFTKILNNLNCSGSYCQEYSASEGVTENENKIGWKLYIKEYDMYSALVLFHDGLNKDIAEVFPDKNNIELLKDNKTFIKLDIITKKDNKKNDAKNKYSILVPTEESMEAYKIIEAMDKKIDKNIGGNFIGIFDLL
jgi:hypothetical protein